MFGSAVEDVIDEIADIQHQRRVLAAREADLFGRLEMSGVYRADGHGSAKTMVRHVGSVDAGHLQSTEQFCFPGGEHASLVLDVGDLVERILRT